MRLWHTSLLEHLPRTQLLAQWRELNSIYVKQDKHILINFIYEYDKYDLWLYSTKVIEEIKRRNYKIKSFEKYETYFNNVEKFKWLYGYDVFIKHMNKIYLVICCYNLYEKYIRGQEGFSDESIDFITDVITNNPFTKEQLKEYAKGIKKYHLIKE